MNEENLAEQNNLKDNNPDLQKPERHGVVTVWLYIMLISNSLLTLIYLIRIVIPSRLITTPTDFLIALLIAGVLNTVFSIMLLSYKKLAFYGFCVIGIIVFLINIDIGISIGKALLGLTGPIVLFCVLQIKKNGISAWNYLT